MTRFLLTAALLCTLTLPAQASDPPWYCAPALLRAAMGFPQECYTPSYDKGEPYNAWWPAQDPYGAENGGYRWGEEAPRNTGRDRRTETRGRAGHNTRNRNGG